MCWTRQGACGPSDGPDRLAYEPVAHAMSGGGLLSTGDAELPWPALMELSVPLEVTQASRGLGLVWASDPKFTARGTTSLYLSWSSLHPVSRTFSPSL